VSTIKVDTYLTRGGASEIAIDKLKGVSSASSISVVAEGGTNTTNLQQGLAKAWCKTTGVGTPALGDSHNMASVTDQGTGVETFQFTSAMVNALFSTSASGQLDGTVITIQQRTDSSLAPTTARTGVHTHSIVGGNTDCNKSVTVHGDLA